MAFPLQLMLLGRPIPNEQGEFITALLAFTLAGLVGALVVRRMQIRRDQQSLAASTTAYVSVTLLRQARHYAAEEATGPRLPPPGLSGQAAACPGRGTADHQLRSPKGSVFSPHELAPSRASKPF